jgi:hypothetical protein
VEEHSSRFVIKFFCLGLDPSILWHSWIWGAADEAVFNIVRKKQKIPPKNQNKIFLWLLGRVSDPYSLLIRIRFRIQLGWIPIRNQSGSRVVMTKNWKKITVEKKI